MKAQIWLTNVKKSEAVCTVSEVLGINTDNKICCKMKEHIGVTDDKRINVFAKCKVHMQITLSSKHTGLLVNLHLFVTYLDCSLNCPFFWPPAICHG